MATRISTADTRDRLIEVHWSRPRAGAMIGMFRILEGERTLMVEASTLIERPGGADDVPPALQSRAGTVGEGSGRRLNHHWAARSS
jgi:hypothetical protein